MAFNDGNGFNDGFENVYSNKPLNNGLEIMTNKTELIFNESEMADDSMKTEIYIDDLPVSVAMASVIGKRPSQQDSVIIPDYKHMTLNDKTKFICILSDGMGGLSGGEIASKTVTQNMYKDYYAKVWSKENPSYFEFLSTEANIVNDKVLELTDENGNPLNAGATVVAVIIDGYNMHFLNIGDSRIYIIRDGSIYQITHDQNYLSVLMEKVRNDEITLEEAEAHPKKEALVSYCGIKDLRIKEINIKPVKMNPGDSILLCSDGLYRVLSDSEICDIVSTTKGDTNIAAYKLTAAAMAKNYRGQDNTSVILINFI